MNPIKITIRKILIFPFVLLIYIYRWGISPWIGPKCRYTPTCSKYALDAFRKYGLIKGFLKTIKRVSSCHPWGGSGYDPA
jgi:putative membrane protein insertion efficiency factor